MKETPLTLKTLPLNLIKQNRFQPRSSFQESPLEDLANSIGKKGDVAEPVVVRPQGKSFELVAGGRRVKAAHQAGLKSVSGFVREMSDLEAEEFSLASNLQREELNPLDKAESLACYAAHIADTDGLDKGVEEIKIARNFKNSGKLEGYSRKIDDMLIRLTGKDAEYFCRYSLPLLQMEPFLREAVASLDIDPSKAALISTVKDPNTQKQILDTALKEDLGWRAVKEAVVLAKGTKEVSTSSKSFIYNPFQPTKVKVSALMKVLENGNVSEETETEIASLIDQVFRVLEASELVNS